jgi:hypothetical protein
LGLFATITIVLNATILQVPFKPVFQIRKFLDLPDPDLLLFVWIRILPSTSKKVKKCLDFYCIVTSKNYLSLKTDVNIPTSSTVNELNNLEQNLKATKGKSRVWMQNLIHNKCTDPRFMVPIRIKKNVTTPENCFVQYKNII